MDKISKFAIAGAGAAIFAGAYASIVAKTFVLDAPHSAVGFTVPIAGGLSHMQGRFNKFKAEIKYDPNNLPGSSVNATIYVSSLDTGVAGRDLHTLGKEGFDASRYPVITFVSKRIEKDGKNFKAVGDLTMRGVKKEIVVPFHVTGARTLGEGMTLLGFEGGFRVNRTDFGLRWEMPGSLNWVGHDVDVQISVLARPQSLGTKASPRR
jgi:polyisoprenoid-binding protein YceI